MTRRLEALLEGNLELRRRMARADTLEERLRVISDAPIYTFWTEIRDEIKEAADELERLRNRVKALEGEDA
ncbi:MAG: hypothetical protein EBR73_12425 [Rhodobacteraceae bacterium]|nr:hypothetical protein [Paracoccaceae bacterium]